MGGGGGGGMCSTRTVMRKCKRGAVRGIRYLGTKLTSIDINVSSTCSKFHIQNCAKSVHALQIGKGFSLFFNFMRGFHPEPVRTSHASCIMPSGRAFISHAILSFVPPEEGLGTRLKRW